MHQTPIPDTSAEHSNPIGGVRARLAEGIEQAGARHDRWRSILVAVALLVVGAGWGFNQWRSSQVGPPIEQLLERATTPAAPATGTTVDSSSGVNAGDIVVQVQGAVRNPGVYNMASDARVNDLVEKAGGAAADADLERINLAAKLLDGQRIYVLRKGQPAAPLEAGGSASEASAPDPSAVIVDLNAATLTQLDALPGVGPATAQAILDYRKTSGPFRSVEDLGKVKGIGPAKLAALKVRVRV